MIINGIVITCAYFVGALPTGFLIARAHGITDITKHGSGNIGATNVARILGISYFFLVFILDCSKAYGYLALLQYFGIDNSFLLMSAFALLIGNGYSIFLNGCGGKGIATSVGLLLFYQPGMLVMLLVIWLVILFFVRTIGIASVSAVIAAPLHLYFFPPEDPHVWYLIVGIVSWCIYRHADNIKHFMMNKFSYLQRTNHGI